MNHDKMNNISAKRGFLWPSFEIYSGVSGFTDYGPLGASLKNNIMQKWRKQYVSGEGFYEIEGPTVMPKEVLKASGHVDNFTDPMCKCEKCGEVFRADHIIEEVIGEDVESLENEELDQIVIDNNITCPECGGKLSNIWNYNLMFKTEIGAKGDKVGYMRPETAQGIFILFKRLERFFRGKLPFGAVQLGKAYRNEISPRQGVIRLREFTQAEAEIFLNPKDKTHPKFSQIEDVVLRLNSQEVQEKDLEPLEITAREALDQGIVANEMLIYQLYLARKFLTEIGIPEDVLRFRQHLAGEMAHYALDCWDVEVLTDKYGWVSEWAGIDLICKAFDKMNEEKVADKTGQTNPNFPPDFVTIAHYRRIPDPDCTKRIYVAQPRVFTCTVAQQYASMHFIEDLKYLGEAIKALYPNLVQHTEHVLNGNIFIPYNIVTCPYGQFRDWAAFVINVLKKAHELAGNHTFEETVEIIKRRKVPENEGRDNRPEYQARWLSMLSERASTIYWLQCAKQVPVFPMKINLMEKGQKI